MIFNSPAIITQYWGNNPQVYRKYDLLGHDGLDLKPEGDDLTINSISYGTITDIYYSGTYGNTILVFNFITKMSIRYAHLTKIYPKEGWTTYPDMPLGIMGESGNTTGPHLHLHLVPMEKYEIKLHPDNGYKGRVDPLQYLETHMLLK